MDELFERVQNTVQYHQKGDQLKLNQCSHQLSRIRNHENLDILWNLQMTIRKHVSLTIKNE